MKRRWALPVGMLLLWVVALAWRVPQLAERPMHGDEAVHAVKLDTLWEKGKYEYDPQEYHGPTLYYCTLPILWLSGSHTFSDVNEVMLRIVPALFGAGLILLVWLMADGLGRWAAFWGGVFMTISPCMVFYSRYYIQETLLVFFTLAAIAAAYRYARSGRLLWCLLAGACLGLMHATKETWIMSVAAMVAAALMTLLWTHWIDDRKVTWRPLIKTRDVTRAAILAVAVSVLLFSTFLTNPRGPLDSILAYNIYFNRGGGNSVHNHPWDYYLHLLLYTRSSKGPIFSSRLPLLYNFSPPIAWSEAFIVLLSLAGMLAALWHKGIGRAHLSFVRFLTFYTLFLTLIYCAIPYKTPWCMMNFLVGMILLAGFGAASLVRSLRFVPLKVLACLVMMVLGLQLANQSYAANFKYSADRRNPYVYAHTSKDILRFASDLENLAKLSPEGHDMLISVISSENNWPLPWYVRRFSHVGYWPSLAATGSPDQQALVLSAPLII
ncbi:MAG: TIGR03663 family protein, partial [Abitibacteriaceae bacterium]|nr:TIGR03663 family protein [Abditibacteriaceae bacterium]